MKEFGGGNRYEDVHTSIDALDHSREDVSQFLTETRNELLRLSEIDFSSPHVREQFCSHLDSSQKKFAEASAEQFDNHFHCKDFSQVESLFTRYVDEGFLYVSPSEHYSFALSRQFRKLSEERGVDLEVPFDCAEIVVKDSDVLFHCKLYVDPAFDADALLQDLHMRKQKLSFPDFEELAALTQDRPMKLSVAHPDIIAPDDDSIVESRKILSQAPGVSAIELGHRDLDAESIAYYLDFTAFQNMLHDGGSDYHGYWKEEDLGISNNISLKDLYLSFADSFSTYHFDSLLDLEPAELKNTLLYLKKQYAFSPDVSESLMDCVASVFDWDSVDVDSFEDLSASDRGSAWNALYLHDRESFDVQYDSFLSDFTHHMSNPAFVSSVSFAIDDPVFLESCLAMPDALFDEYCRRVFAFHSSQYDILQSFYDMIPDIDSSKRFTLYSVARKNNYSFTDSYECDALFESMYLAAAKGLESVHVACDDSTLYYVSYVSAYEAGKYRFAMDLLDSYYVACAGDVDMTFLKKFDVMKKVGASLHEQKAFFDGCLYLCTSSDAIDYAKAYLDICMLLHDRESADKFLLMLDHSLLDSHHEYFEYRDSGISPNVDVLALDDSSLCVLYSRIQFAFDSEKYDVLCDDLQKLIEIERENKYAHSYVRRFFKKAPQELCDSLSDFLESHGISTSRFHFRSRMDSTLSEEERVDFLSMLKTLSQKSSNDSVQAFVSDLFVSENLFDFSVSDVDLDESVLSHRISHYLKKIGDDIYYNAFLKTGILS